MNLDIGTLFRWNNFPYPRYGTEIKPRWFIYLGETGPFSQIAILYLATTTTQIQHFQHDGTRAGHAHFKFDIRQFTMFDEDCIIDFDEKPYPIEKEKFLNRQTDIAIKGKFNDDTLRMIYNRFLKSGACSKMEMLDIHNSFNNANITSLKKP